MNAVNNRQVQLPREGELCAEEGGRDRNTNRIKKGWERSLYICCHWKNICTWRLIYAFGRGCESSSAMQTMR